MKISKGMLDHYIGHVTDWYVAEHDEPADELSDYYDCVIRIKTQATRRKDLDILRLGINYLRCHPEIDTKDYGKGMYPYDDEEVREILDYIYSVIWSDNTKINCEEVRNIELVNSNRFDWWKSRGVKP